jgi:hypothetical protein
METFWTVLESPTADLAGKIRKEAKRLTTKLPKRSGKRLKVDNEAPGKVRKEAKS